VPERVLVAAASGSEDLIPTLIEKMREIQPDAPLYVISEFPVEGIHWIPFHVKRTFNQNLDLCLSTLKNKEIIFTGLILQPNMPYWQLRWIAFRLGGLRTLFFNEQLDHFMLRPRSVPVIAKHFWWRLKNIVRWELRPGGATYTFLWRLAHPSAFERPLLWRLARLAGWTAGWRKAPAQAAADPPPAQPAGISVVVPSRNGRELLDRLLPGLLAGLEGIDSEVLVVDNGSDDGTAQHVHQRFPGVTAIVSPEPLSFAGAVNRGIRQARYSHTMLLNNDMVIEPGFFPPLLKAFAEVPRLFCATAQIFFPAGVRREETGKAVMPPGRKLAEFPLTCDPPVDGEDQTYVLYGSGGCSLYDTAKLRALGGFLEIFEPAYVEDLDLGWRGWLRGWPTVFVAGARLEHRQRATTSRYYSERELAVVLEVNYLKFLARSVATRASFRSLWSRAVGRLNAVASSHVPDPVAMAVLRQSWRAPLWADRQEPEAFPESWIPQIGSGAVAVFPGAARTGRPTVLVASPYLPFPLTHGGAVRMYNLMREGARSFDQVLICFADQLHTPPKEILDLCSEVIQVRREGSHARPMTARPDVVEEFDSPVFRSAMRLACEKWRPAVVQLEFTQMAVYTDVAAPRPAILVEHDVTFDLYAQLLENGEDWETQQQYERWVRFETEAWKQVAAVVVMSDKDRARTGVAHAVSLPNGVDLDRFQPAASEPDPARVLFIGSFAHLPNVLAVDFFLRSAWPMILAARPDARFHVIAGKRPEYFLERFRDRVQPPLDSPGVELQDFVADPRDAYRRATVVVAPLLASAGTNIKVMEAMAMGRAVVSTPGGVNGLDDLRPGTDYVLAAGGGEMAAAVLALIADPGRRGEIERSGRAVVEARYGWRAIGERQRELYERLRGGNRIM